jgi:hypothetical protein
VNDDGNGYDISRYGTIPMRGARPIKTIKALRFLNSRRLLGDNHKAQLGSCFRVANFLFFSHHSGK